MPSGRVVGLRDVPEAALRLRFARILLRVPLGGCPLVARADLARARGPRHTQQGVVVAPRDPRGLMGAKKSLENLRNDEKFDRNPKKNIGNR